MVRRLFTSELEAQLERHLPGFDDAGGIHRAVQGLEALARSDQDLVLHWVEVAAQGSLELALNVALLAPAALAQLDAEGFETWVLCGLEMKDREDVRTAIAYLKDIDDFVAAYQHSGSVATFEDVVVRTSLFLQAISGEPIDIKLDAHAWTDSRTLYLPPELAALPAAADNQRLYKIMATLLWAQTRYGTLTDANALPQNVLLRYAEDKRALRLLAGLEAVRLEAKLAPDFPGLVAEIAELRGPWPPALAAALPRLSRPEATLADTVAVLDEFLATDLDLPLMIHVARIDPAAAFRNLRAQKRTDGKPRFGAQQQEFDALPGDYESGEAAGEGKEAEDQAQGDFSPHRTGHGAMRRDDAHEARAPHSMAAAAEPDFVYDEWDYKRGVYRKDWCKLYEVEVAGGDPNYVNEVKRKYRNYIQQIRRQLEMIKGEDRMLSRQSDGEELDVDAVIESMIDRKNGGEPSDHLFCRRNRNERSLAVMFMVDMSGSTKGWVNNAERESLILLCEALELLNDNYAIYGFSGWGHERCEIYPIKRFGEAYDNTVRARIAGIEGRDFTRMGVAIRHLSKLLEQEPARHHLLVTISDGYPDDFGDEYRNDYGIEDTRRALQEAHERGVRSFCVTIDRQGADYLPRLYGPARYEVVPTAFRLPMRMAEIYRHLTT